MRNITWITAVIFTAWVSTEVLAQAGITARILREVVPLDQMAKRVFQTISKHIEPAKVKVTSDGAIDTIRSVIRPGVQASTAAAAIAQQAKAASSVPSTASLYVIPNVPGADIKIMNIAPKYQDGIKLAPKDYEVLVSKPEYRTKRFWVSIPKGASGKKIDIDVALQPLGLPNCESNVRLSTYGSPLLKGGQVVQIQALFLNSDINDLYLSYAEHAENANFIQVINTVVHPDYVEMTLRQPSSLSPSDIDNNRNIEIDENRFAPIRISFEVENNGVLVTTQAFMPPGVFARRFNEETVCKYAFNY